MDNYHFYLEEEMGRYFCSSVDNLIGFLREYFGVGEPVWFHANWLPEGLTPPDGPEDRMWSWLHARFDSISEVYPIFSLMVNADGTFDGELGSFYRGKRGGETFLFNVRTVEKKYLPPM